MHLSSATLALSAPLVVSKLDEPYDWLVWQLYPGALVLALVHVWLALRYHPRRATRAA